jgi:hypothetical protein
MPRTAEEDGDEALNSPTPILNLPRTFDSNDTFAGPV